MTTNDVNKLYDLANDTNMKVVKISTVQDNLGKEISEIKLSIEGIKNTGCRKRTDDIQRITEAEGNIKLLDNKASTNRALLWIILVVLVGSCIGIIANNIMTKAEIQASYMEKK